jgi:hypothetical protein
MLEMLANGASMREIAFAFEVSPNVAARAVRDALVRRAAQVDLITSTIARALIIDRLELIIGKVMPLATGTLTGMPDLKAVAEMVNMLKLMAQLHNVPMGGKTATVEITNNNTLIAVEKMRDDIMDSLDQVADRAQVIQGTLT